jgi:hypothetical protein
MDRLQGSPAVFAVPTVLAPPTRPVLTAVATVPAFLTIPALVVVPIVPEIGTAATAPASAAIAAAVGGGVDEHSRGHPPDGIEETEAEQDRDEDEEQDEHGGPPRERDTASIPGTGASPTA